MDEAFFTALDEHSEDESDHEFSLKDEEEGQNGEEEEDVDEEAEHMKTLEALKETDPAFYEYLKQNDKDLLMFGQGAENKSERRGKKSGKNREEVEDDEESEDEGMDEEQEGRKKGGIHEPEGDVEDSATKGRKKVTTKLLKSWAASALKGGFMPTKKLVLAFRAACHSGDATAAGAEEDDGSSPSFTFAIASSSVFNHLMLFCLRNMPTIFNNMLGYAGQSNWYTHLPTTCAPLIFSIYIHTYVMTNI